MKRLFPFLVVFAFACNASASPLNTSTEIVTSITTPEQFSFDFGSISKGVVGRTLTLGTSGTASPVLEITLLDGYQGGVARLVTAGTPALATVTVTVTTSAFGDETTMIVSHCQGPGGALGTDNGNCTVQFNEVIDDDVYIRDKPTVGGTANPLVFKLEP